MRKCLRVSNPLTYWLTNKTTYDSKVLLRTNVKVNFIASERCMMTLHIQFKKYQLCLVFITAFLDFFIFIFDTPCTI